MVSFENDPHSVRRTAQPCGRLSLFEDFNTSSSVFFFLQTKVENKRARFVFFSMPISSVYFHSERANSARMSQQVVKLYTILTADRQTDRQLSCTALIHGTLSLNLKAQISENNVWACLTFQLSDAWCIPLFTILRLNPN